MGNIYSDDLYNVFNASETYARQFNHASVGTPHLFLSLWNFLYSNQDSDKYASTFIDLKKILNDFEITNDSFRKAFFKFCPMGKNTLDDDATIDVDEEFKCVMQNIKKDALNTKKTQEIETLILELFSDSGYILNRIVEEILDNELKVSEFYDRIIQRFKVVIAVKIDDLEKIPALTNLNEYLVNKEEVVIGADEMIKKIEMGLSGKSIKSICLTGKAGTGKTQYVHEFVNRINHGKVPKQFRDKIVYELDTGSLVAGTRYRGDLEEKFDNILKNVKKHPEVIIFIDEIHAFIKEGKSSDGGQCCGQLIKPYLTRGEIQIIGATTAEEYTQNILPDKAFERRLTEIKIEEPNTEALKKILNGILPSESEYFNKKIQTELVDKVIELSDKYSLELANPAKAINMLELACAYASVFEEKKETVDLDDIIHSIKLRYNIYISDNKVEDTEKELFTRLLDQDQALNQIIRDLKIVDRNIVDTKKPMISMLFCGPTGTGKTESAKIIAENFFGSEKNLVKINMGEYSTEQDITKISGASAGYIGFENEPELIKCVREKPNSVVLFDEIEKAHPSIQKILLNILDEGELTDNKGNAISFRNTIIIFTTNLGYRTNSTTKSITQFGENLSSSGLKTYILKEIENYFSPEFLGRLDDIVFFKQLSENVIKTLINRYLDEYKQIAKDLDVEFTDEDYQTIINNSDILNRGARGVKKAVRKQIIAVEDRS